MLSDEEKEALEILKAVGIKCKGICIDEVIINLIEKQSKEIEELKNNKGYHLGFIDGGIAKRYEMEDKIKDLEKIIEFEKPTYEDVLKYAIEVLQSLLEKE